MKFCCIFWGQSVRHVALGGKIVCKMDSYLSSRGQGRIISVKFVFAVGIFSRFTVDFYVVPEIVRTADKILSFFLYWEQKPTDTEKGNH